jgi:hypothetical protein
MVFHRVSSAAERTPRILDPMKTPLRLVLAVGLLALTLTGCATSPQAADAPTRQTRQAAAHMAEIKSTKAAGLIVISAVYGSGDKYADVTGRVNDLLRDPRAYFWAKPAWLQADPAPGWNKALVVVYELDGRRRIFSTGEGGTVSVGRLLENAERTSDAAKKKSKPKGKAKDVAP